MDLKINFPVLRNFMRVRTSGVSSDTVNDDKKVRAIKYDQLKHLAGLVFCLIIAVSQIINEAILKKLVFFFYN